MVSHHKEKLRQDSERTDVGTETEIDVETETDGREPAEPIKPPSVVGLRPFEASDTTVAIGNHNSGMHLTVGFLQE